MSQQQELLKPMCMQLGPRSGCQLCNNIDHCCVGELELMQQSLGTVHTLKAVDLRKLLQVQFQGAADALSERLTLQQADSSFSTGAAVLAGNF